MGDNYIESNRELWNEWTGIHEKSAFYDLPGFKAGKSSLSVVETQELGDVAGKSLLHLQCHFGMDTLSWARRGAQVTGVDISDRAIDLAQSLSAELNIPARFIRTDLFSLPQVLEGQFDIVYTSYGVLCWLPDLTLWAAVIAHFLKPGGVFYIVESHPFAYFFDDSSTSPEWRAGYDYFHSPQPYQFKVQGSYADPQAQVAKEVSYEWNHTLGDIVNSLAGAGLTIEYMHEFPFVVYPMFPFLERQADELWHIPQGMHQAPLMFSLRAAKKD